MRSGTFEIETVARLEFVVALILQPDFEFAAKNVEEFFAFVGVGLAAAAARLDAEEMGFHGGIAPGQQFHADGRTAFQDFAIRRTDERRGIAVRIEEGQEIRLEEPGNALQSGDGGTHLAAFQRAEEAHRDAGGPRHLGQ